MTTEAAEARATLLRQELARFIEIVTQQMQPESIILFGSLALGRLMSGLTLTLWSLPTRIGPSTNASSTSCRACVCEPAWMS